MRALLRLELTDAAGRTLAVRREHNSVMRGGAQLLADLFAGSGTPITHMGVGTSDEPESDGFTTLTLANESVGGVPALTGATEAPIPPEAFTITTDETRRLVTVRVHGTLAPPQAVGTVREDPVREPGDGVRVVDDERLAGRDAHQRAGKRRKAAEAEHDVRAAAPDDAQALNARRSECVRSEQQRAKSLAANAAKRHALELDAVLRHEPRFHAIARAEPEHAAAARDELRGDGETREHVAAGAAGGDHHRRTHWNTLHADALWMPASATGAAGRPVALIR